ncbi:acyltransferase [Parvibaculum sp.]|uniref:acyltransferase family protein n=1 Tax=Parvibaculum sp. TaxID=2024848 RepID=UPI000C4996AF|nr:acyltransferase [Parvibaculum sp.]MAM94859.1 exopolysaccharide production protein exoz [Parvibaculum sp.]HCX67945.1 exopolysaccharide production protein exoz [Rhodobiaceae bacterium]|tara:strand:+ start:14938 stop:16011 length:1074 start_codon:yes stop_codon:yes gene_type:complete
MPADSTRRLDSVQILRALAALAVIWSHSTLEVSRFTEFDLRSFSALSSMGRIGVDIFFVISGFVMVYVSSRQFGERGEAWRFVLRRIVRVVPVYWFYTSLILGVLLLLPGLLRNNDLSWAHVVASYFFFPMSAPGKEDFHPLLGIGWTLNYEMFFYFMFAPFLLLTRSAAIWALSIVFCGLVFLGLFLSPAHGAIWFWTQPIILEFLAGVLLGRIYLSDFRLPAAVSTGILVLGVGWLVAVAEFWNKSGLDVRFLVTGIPAILFTSAIVLRQVVEDATTSSVWKFLIYLGDASYSLYLVHMFVIRVLTVIISPTMLGAAYPFIYMMGVFGVCIPAAVISYRWIERPANGWLRRQFHV